jgi:hypothetical protein
MTSAAVFVSIIVLASVGIFLALREVWCWYSKQNAIVDELRALRADTKLVSDHLAWLRSEMIARAEVGYREAA